MRNFLIFLLAGALLSACQGEATKGKDSEKEKASAESKLKETLPGSWESVSIRVTVNSADGSDSSYVFDVREENWKQKLGIQPIRTYYSPDNKYRSEYIALNGEIANTTRGLWNVFGDTLMLMATDATYQYHVKVRDNGLVEFRSLLDWDGDGAEDDEYVGVQRYIGQSTE